MAAISTHLIQGGSVMNRIVAPTMTAKAFGLEFEQLLIHMSHIPVPLTPEEEEDTDSRTLFLKFGTKYATQLVRKNIYLYIECLKREQLRPDLIHIAEQLCFSIPHIPGTVLEIFFRQDAVANKELRRAMGIPQSELATRKKLRPLVNPGTEYAVITQGKLLSGNIHKERDTAAVSGYEYPELDLDAEFREIGKSNT